MENGLRSGASCRGDVGLMLKSARLAEASKETEIRMRFAHDIAAPLLARAFDAQRVWVFGSVATKQARPDSDIDILVEGGEGLSAARRLTIAYDIISSLSVPCGCDVVVLTGKELADRKEVSFIKSLLEERVLVYAGK